MEPALFLASEEIAVPLSLSRHERELAPLMHLQGPSCLDVRPRARRTQTIAALGGIMVLHR